MPLLSEIWATAPGDYRTLNRSGRIQEICRPFLEVGPHGSLEERLRRHSSTSESPGTISVITQTSFFSKKDAVSQSTNTPDAATDVWALRCCHGRARLTAGLVGAIKCATVDERETYNAVQSFGSSWKGCLRSERTFTANTSAK